MTYDLGAQRGTWKARVVNEGLAEKAAVKPSPSEHNELAKQMGEERWESKALQAHGAKR